jgi:hypothetical protein
MSVAEMVPGLGSCKVLLARAILRLELCFIAVLASVQWTKLFENLASSGYFPFLGVTEP